MLLRAGALSNEAIGFEIHLAQNPPRDYDLPADRRRAALVFRPAFGALMSPATAFDLLIRHARLRARPGELVDIGLRGGQVTAIAPELPAAAERELYAQGGLVTESFANPHLHLDKVLPPTTRRTMPRRI